MSVRSAVDFDGGIPVGIQDLESVLSTGDNAGGLNITNLTSITAITYNGVPLGTQTLGQTLTNGNEASKDINMDGFALTNVSSINGFSTNRNTQGEFIAQQTISATANIDFTIALATAITLDIGTYLANIKINLSDVTATTSYIIYLYLNDGVTDDLLTSSVFSSASTINAVSLTIPAFPVAVTTDNSILTLRGRVNTTSSVVVAGFGDSYINCGLIFAGAVAPPNPPPLPASWVFTSQTIGGLTSSKWGAPSVSTDNSKYYLVNSTSIPYQSTDKGLNWSQAGSITTTSYNVSATNTDGTTAYLGINTGALYKYDGIEFVLLGSVGSGINQIATTPSGNDSALITTTPSKFFTTTSPTAFAETAVTNAPPVITWSGVNISSTGGISYILCASDNQSIYYKNTAGVWSLSTPNIAETGYSSITSTADFGVIYIVSNACRIYKSTNQGTSWTLIKTFSFTTSEKLILSCNANDGSKLVFAIPFTILSISNDSGVNWDDNIIGSYQYQSWTGASFSGDGTNLLLTAGESRGNGVSLVGTYS